MDAGQGWKELGAVGFYPESPVAQRARKRLGFKFSERQGVKSKEINISY